MLTSSSFALFIWGIFLYRFSLKWLVILLKSPTSTGYFSNSTSLSITIRRFFPDIALHSASTHRIWQNARRLAKPSCAYSHLPHNCLRSYEYIIIIKAKIHVLIKWSYRSPLPYWILNLEWLTYFEHKIQSLLNTCFFGVHFRSAPNHIPLKYRFPNYCYVGFRHTYLNLNGINWLSMSFHKFWPNNF